MPYTSGELAQSRSMDLHVRVVIRYPTLHLEVWQRAALFQKRKELYFQQRRFSANTRWPEGTERMRLRRLVSFSP